MEIKSLLKKGLLAGCIAAVANTAIYFIARSAGLVNDTMLLPPGKPLWFLAVIIHSLIPAIVAGLLLFGFFKIFKNPRKAFVIAGIIFLLVSMAGPLGIPGLTVGMRIILALMHIVAGVLIIYFLTRPHHESKI